MKHICTQADRIQKIESLLDPNTWIVMDKLQKLEDWQKEIVTTIKELVDKLDSKYASKWVEVSIKWAAGIIIWIVLSAMVYNVIITK